MEKPKKPVSTDKTLKRPSKNPDKTTNDDEKEESNTTEEVKEPDIEPEVPVIEPIESINSTDSFVRPGAN